VDDAQTRPRKRGPVRTTTSDGEGVKRDVGCASSKTRRRRGPVTTRDHPAPVGVRGVKTGPPPMPQPSCRGTARRPRNTWFGSSRAPSTDPS